MKICIDCSLNMELSEFSIRADTGKHRNSCKVCRTEYKRTNRKINSERIAANKHQYYEDNKDKEKVRIAEWTKVNRESVLEKKKAYYRLHRAKHIAASNKRALLNKDKIRSYMREYGKSRSKKDIHFRLRNNLRSRLNEALKNNLKTGSAVSDLGCSVAKLKIYLQLKFHRHSRDKHEYMTWDNYGKYGWHIDHIKPLTDFDLTDRNQLLRACHYTNLQPLWAIDNIKKGNKHV